MFRTFQTIQIAVVLIFSLLYGVKHDTLQDHIDEFKFFNLTANSHVSSFHTRIWDIVEYFNVEMIIHDWGLKKVVANFYFDCDLLYQRILPKPLNDALCQFLPK